MGGRVLLLAVSPRHIQTAAAQPAAGLHRSLVVRFFGNAYKNHKNNNNCLKKKKKPPEEKAALCRQAPTARFAKQQPATAEAARPFATLPPVRALLLRGGAARRACAPPGAAGGPRPFHRTAPGPRSAPRGRAPHCARPGGGSGSAR